MSSRWFSIAVVALWLTTMGWLVSTKVVPAILVGEPPSYPAIIEARREDPPVAWAMAWNDRPIGWALNTTLPLPHRLTELRSRVHFDDIPMEDIAKLPWFTAPARGHRVALAVDVLGELVFDPFGRLSRFESSLGMDGVESLIKVRGTIDNGKLSLTVRAGDFNYEKEMPVPPKSMLSDGLSPQTHLPGLREGQKWTVELYSPFHPPERPLEVLQVAVEGSEPMVWAAETVDAWLVVYRTDPGAGGRNAGAVRGRVWVRPDGVVLRQQAMLFNSTLTFTRLPDESARALADEFAEK
ncbi:MAG: hypothetical protein GXY83_18470 [Rhodopirellula sp.]|nr:hypothetical protein [Rhodopirellula sp.]